MRFLMLCLMLSSCGVIQSVRDVRYEEVPEVIPLPERLAVPTAVVFDIDTVIVGMDDGTQCRGPAGAALTAGGWTGGLVECPYPYRYAVELAAGTTAGREFLEPTTTSVFVEEGEVPFRPLVTVIITDTTGQRFRFQSINGF